VCRGYRLWRKIHIHFREFLSLSDSEFCQQLKYTILQPSFRSGIYSGIFVHGFLPEPPSPGGDDNVSDVDNNRQEDKAGHRKEYDGALGQLLALVAIPTTPVCVTLE
jgi:hypothetical protein